MKILGWNYQGFAYGDVVIKPTPTEGALFAAGAGTMAYGFWNGRNLLAAAGIATMGAVAYRAYEKAKEVQNPELMNGYYVTQGEASASGDRMGDLIQLAGAMGKKHARAARQSAGKHRRRG